jgi:hypothetical protein
MTDFRSFIHSQLITESQTVTEGPIWDTVKHKLALAGTNLASQLPLVGTAFKGMHDTRQVMDQMIKMWSYYRGQQGVEATADHVINFMHQNNLPVPDSANAINKNIVLDRGDLFDLFKESSRIFFQQISQQARTAVSGEKGEDGDTTNVGGGVRNVDSGGGKLSNKELGQKAAQADPVTAKNWPKTRELIAQKLRIEASVFDELIKYSHQESGNPTEVGERVWHEAKFPAGEKGGDRALLFIALLLSGYAKDRHFINILERTFKRIPVADGLLGGESLSQICANATGPATYNETFKQIVAVVAKDGSVKPEQFVPIVGGVLIAYGARINTQGRNGHGPKPQPQPQQTQQQGAKVNA